MICRKHAVLPLLALCAAALAPAYAETPAALGERLANEVAPKAGTAAITARLPQMQTAGRCTEAQALGVLGAGYVVVKQVEPALYCFARAVALEPTNPEFLNNAGFVLLDQKRHDEAAVMLQAAYALAPDSAEICMNLGKLAWRQGDKNRALTLLGTAAREEGDPTYAYSLAKAQFYAGQKNSAKQTLEGSLGRFPTHQPSLDLYQKVTGQSYKSEGVRAMVREAVAIGGQVQDQIHEMARELDRIAKACGDKSKPGSQWAVGQLRFSDIYIKQATTELAANPTTNDIVAINALGSVAGQLRLLGTCNHQFGCALYLWRHSAPQAGFKIEFSGTYNFSDDTQELGAPWLRYHKALMASRGVLTPELIAAAKAYLAAMPASLDGTAAGLNRALQAMFKADAVLWAQYTDFTTRHADLFKSTFAHAQLENQNRSTHAHFDPAAASGCRQGIMWTQGIWQHYLEFHQQELHSAAELIKQPEPEVHAPLTAEDVLRAWADACAASGVSATIKLNFEICSLSLSSDGTVSLQVGQGAMVVTSYNVFHENWTSKIGVGFDLANPGVVGGELSTGAFLNWDSQQGLGCEVGVSASMGFAEVGFSQGTYFASSL
ncbi:MAG: tetratricopeptide repeat protein [Armatimonadetes bacterium]|nr:tetratricopeptide repeat protein [Armatimonadota bacterium]